MSEKIYTQEEFDRAYDTGLKNGRSNDAHNLYASKETVNKFESIEKEISNNHSEVLKTLGEFKATFCEFRGEFVTKLDAIERQTTKTNGRVSSLENWKLRIVGAIAVILFIVFMGRDVLVGYITKLL